MWLTSRFSAIWGTPQQFRGSAVAAPAIMVLSAPMIGRLFSSRRDANQRSARTPTRPVAPQPPARVPAGTRVYAIGDVHGRYDLLCELEQSIISHLHRHPVDRPVLIYIGDYVDRGYESRQVIDHLIAPPPAGFERICLKGNHEDFLLRFLDDTGVAHMWLVNGGRETLLSYDVALTAGLDLEKQIEGAQTALRDCFPVAHRDFLQSLPLAHIEGDFLFVHAGVRPGVPTEQQQESDLLWIRDQFLRSTKRLDGRVVVHGHTVVSEPDIQDNRIAIDTGAFATGRLTCLVIEDTDLTFIRTG